MRHTPRICVLEHKLCAAVLGAIAGQLPKASRMLLQRSARLMTMMCSCPCTNKIYLKSLILQLRLQKHNLRFHFASATLKVCVLRPAVWSGLAARSGREKTHVNQIKHSLRGFQEDEPSTLPCHTCTASLSWAALSSSSSCEHKHRERERDIISIYLSIYLSSRISSNMQPPYDSQGLSTCRSAARGVHLRSPSRPCSFSKSDLGTLEALCPSLHAESCSRAVATGSETPSFESSCHSRACREAQRCPAVPFIKLLVLASMRSARASACRFGKFRGTHDKQTPCDFLASSRVSCRTSSSCWMRISRSCIETQEIFASVEILEAGARWGLHVASLYTPSGDWQKFQLSPDMCSWTNFAISRWPCPTR